MKNFDVSKDWFINVAFLQHRFHLGIYIGDRVVRIGLGFMEIGLYYYWPALWEAEKEFQDEN